MNLKQYLGVMSFSTLICWAAWIFVILQVNPLHTNTLGFLFFYISLGFALLGTISLIVFTLYRVFGSRDIPLFRHVRMSFRTACLISLLVIVGLYLQSLGVFSVFNLLIFATICILVVSFDLSFTGEKNTSYNR